MFESFKEWLNEAFRPVIGYVAETGQSFIKRTPTIDDVDIVRQTRYVRVPFNHAAGVTSGVTELINSAARPIMVTRVSGVIVLNAAQVFWYFISPSGSGNSDALEVGGQVGISNPLIPAILNNLDQKIIITPGNYLGMINYLAAGTARTGYYYITYVEL